MDRTQELLYKVYSLVREYQVKQQEKPLNMFYAVNKNAETNELMHSYFLHSLLKTKVEGKYIFLKLFIGMLNKKFGLTLDYKDFANPNKIQTEYSLGPITQDLTRGGRIDIILNNNKEPIIIENKIYAENQNRQLYRYYKAFQKSKIFYLTLYGTEAPEESIYNMEKEGGKYYPLSYSVDILAWLQSCQKQGIKSQPLLSALEQYEEVIKNLTWQGDNLKMEKEIIKTSSLTAENVLASFYIHKNYNLIYNNFITTKILNPLKGFLKQKFGEQYHLTEEYFRNKPGDLIFGFTIKHKNWQNIIIRFNSETFNNYTALYGISSCYRKVAPREIFEYFRTENFPSNKPSLMWPLIYELDYSPLSLALLEKMTTEESKIVSYYESKIEEMILLTQKAEKDGITL